MVSVTSGGLVKRSVSFDPDVLAWLRERGRQDSRSVDWLVRQILRAAMDASERREEGAAA